ARDRLWTWAAGDLAKYRRGFAYVDGDGKDKGQYKLPHHDVIAGELQVVWRGVAAAWAAVSGARADMGLSASDQKAVKAHLAKHYAQFGKDVPDEPKSVLAHTTMEEVERIITNRMAQLNWDQIAERAVDEALARAQGRI